MYNESLTDKFNKSNIIKKLLLLKNSRYIEINNKAIGYLWWRNITGDFCELKSFYIDEQNVNDDILKELKNELISQNKRIVYETFNRKNDPEILQMLNFNKKSITEVLYLYRDYKFDIIENEDIIYKESLIDYDEKLRCELQNNIFYDEERIPLTINDIYYDEEQDYYIEDLSIMMIYKNEPIGYGQIIKNKNKYTLVNFGIVESCRGKGFGKLLLKHIINKCIDKGIYEIYLRVLNENNSAKSLYRSLGFNYIGKITNWEMEKATIK